MVQQEGFSCAATILPSAPGARGHHFVSMEGKAREPWEMPEGVQSSSRAKWGTTISASNFSEMVKEVMKGVFQEQLGKFR